MSFFQNSLVRKLMESKMKNVPQAEKERIFNLIDKNPALFQQILEEIQNEIKSGKEQMTATMEVMKRHEEELKKISDKPNNPQ